MPTRSSFNTIATRFPDSVISRFIVRMDQYVSRPYYWKNGVFLQSLDKNLAKIKADPVRSAIDEINSGFKIGIKQMIPVRGFPQALVSHQDLLAYEEMNEPQIVVPNCVRNSRSESCSTASKS